MRTSPAFGFEFLREPAYATRTRARNYNRLGTQPTRRYRTAWEMLPRWRRLRGTSLAIIQLDNITV